MTDNGGWQTVGNDRQWELANNGEYQINDHNRQWERADQQEWQTMGNELHTIGMTDNEEWMTMLYDKQWGIPGDWWRKTMVNDNRQWGITVVITWSYGHAITVYWGRPFVVTSCKWAEWEMADNGKW